MYKYFQHDEIHQLDNYEKEEEIEFYRKIEKLTIQNALVAGGITSIIGIPITLGVLTGGMGIIPLSIPLIIGSYSVSNVAVSFLSNEKKNELRFKSSKGYKIWQSHLTDIIKYNKKLNENSKRVYYMTFLSASMFFYFLFLHGNRDIFLFIICILIFFFVESYLLTIYIEYNKSITQRTNTVNKWGKECIYYNLEPSEKKLNWLTGKIKYDKETGVIISDKCDKYNRDIYEICPTMLDILFSMGLKSIINNFKELYYSLNIIQFLLWIILFCFFVIFFVFVSSLNRKLNKKEGLKNEEELIKKIV